MIGRRNNYDGNEDTDEPPFNFQVRQAKKEKITQECTLRKIYT